MANSVRWIQAKTGDTAVQYSAVQDRLLVASIWPNEGVLGTGQLKVTQRAAGANMSVDVASGSAVIKCDTVTNGGSYHVNESATVNVAIPAAPGSGSRTHLICEQVRDPQSDGGTNYVSAPICVADTGSGATQPPSAYTLATVTVTAGTASITNAMITDVRAQAAGDPPYDRGSVGDQLSGAGRVTVSHVLGVSPAEIFLTGNVNGRYLMNVISRDENSFIVEFTNPQTGQTGSGGQNVSFGWIAFR